MKPFIVLNLKTYAESTGERAVELCRVAREVSKETDVRIVVCPQAVDMRACAETGAEVFSQGADAFEPGAHTGSLLPFAVRDSGAKGIMINHAERKVSEVQIKEVIEIARKIGMEILVCAANDRELEMAAKLKPDYIAIEPPELIGGGISVSTAKPQIVSGAVKKVSGIDAKILVLCGAGVSNALDVKKAIELGANGVLLASAYAKSKEPRELLLGMAKAVYE